MLTPNDPDELNRALRETTQALQESEERFRVLADAAFEGVVVHDRGTHMFANRAFAEMLGYGPAEVVGRTWTDFVAPESHEVVRERIRAGSEEPYEAIGMRSDGSRFDVEIRGKAVRYQGRTVRVVAIRDVTTRKRAERALRFLADAGAVLTTSLDYDATLQSVARLAVPTLADWCQIYLADGGQLRRVAAAHVDPAQEELLRGILDRYPLDAEGATPTAQVLRSGKPVLIPRMTAALIATIGREPEHQRVLEALRPASAIVAPLTGRQTPLGALTLVSLTPGRYDPDDCDLAEELGRRCGLAIENAGLYREAQEAVRARDHFLSLAAHELKTPTTAVKVSAQHLLASQQRGLLTGERLARLAGTINAASTRLATLVDDLLDVAWLRSGRRALRPERLDLGELVARVAERQGDLTTDHVLRLRLPDLPVNVHADPARLEEVFENLLANAVKYSPDGGPIDLVVEEVDGRAVVRVTDRGIGLPPGETETIFAPFGRAPNAEARHLPGMGLGLYISRGIVEQHGGRLWAESQGEDRGTTMVVDLPGAAAGTAGPPG